MDMRGLKNFIADIRAATHSRDKEVKRVQQELGKIRAKFKTSTKMSPYDRKKYVCKLLFICMLGYDVEFGHMEAVQLLSGHSQSEKIVGYLATSVLLHEGHELITLTTNTVAHDLEAGSELCKCLALANVANTAGREFSDAVAPHVHRIILEPRLPALVRRKGYLAMLRLLRKNPECVEPQRIGEVVCRDIVSTDYGLALSAMALAQGFLGNPDTAPAVKGAQLACCRTLERIILERTTPNDYVHYGVPCPWLQAKALRLLQFVAAPDPAIAPVLSNVLSRIVKATVKVVSEAQQGPSMKRGAVANRTNAMVSVLVEVISLAIAWGNDEPLLAECRDALGMLITDRKDPNMRYLGLTLLTRMSFCETAAGSSPSATAETFAVQTQKHQHVIVTALHDADNSIRQRALDLLYAMAGPENAAQIVGELLDYLPSAEVEFREDLVLMIAILAEKFCNELSWYVDVVVALIEEAGDVVTREVWHRLCHVVVNTPSVQKYAVDKVIRALQRTRTDNEVLVLVTAFLAGEFGYMVALVGGTAPLDQITALYSKWPHVSNDCRAALLSAFVKQYNLFDSAAARDRVRAILDSARSHPSAEVQQRAAEYHALVTVAGDAVLQAALEPMPAFDVDVTAMVNRLRAKRRGEEKNLWSERGTLRDDGHLKQSAVLAAATATSVAAPVGAEVPSRAPVPAAPPTPAAPVVNAAPAAPMEDLDSVLGGAGPAGSAAPALAPTAKTAGLDDIFGGPVVPPARVGAAPAAAESAGSAPVPVAPVHCPPVVAATASAGELYRDAFAVVNFAGEFRGSDGRVTLSVLAPATADTRLEQLSARILDLPSNVLLQQRPIAAGPDGRPPVLAPGGAPVDIQFATRSLAPFTGSLQMALAATAVPVGAGGQGGAWTVTVTMPVATTRFIEPYRVESLERAQGIWRSAAPAPSAGVEPNTGRVGGFSLGMAQLAAAAVRLGLSDSASGVQLGAALVERVLFQQLRLFTAGSSAAAETHTATAAGEPNPAVGSLAVLGVGAHSSTPADQAQFIPCLVRVVVSPTGQVQTVGGHADPFGVAPMTTGGSGDGGVSVTVEARCTNALLEGQLGRTVLAVLQALE